MFYSKFFIWGGAPPPVATRLCASRVMRLVDQKIQNPGVVTVLCSNILISACHFKWYLAKGRLSNIAAVDLSFNPLKTKLLSVQYLERVVSLLLFVTSASYLLYRVQINSLMFSSTHPSTDRNGVNDQTLLAVINSYSLLRPLKFVYYSTRLVWRFTDALLFRRDRLPL